GGTTKAAHWSHSPAEHRIRQAARERKRSERLPHEPSPVSQRLRSMLLPLQQEKRLHQPFAADTLLHPAEGETRPVVPPAERVPDELGGVVVTSCSRLEPRLQVGQVPQHRMLGHWHSTSLAHDGGPSEDPTFPGHASRRLSQLDSGPIPEV